ncbi:MULTISPECIES: hypothetical protein [Acinetobacter calcoaceticus/baumannii complex]|nr:MULTISPECIES: hypothetical protein [Acinetobacter calcoaceticus/baumannii complex]MDM8396131.1 hypothetical protein [Acinetobacter baumannii]
MIIDIFIDNKIIMRTFFSLSLFAVFSLVSFLLLQEKHIQSSDFVLLIISSSVIALVISYFDDIQELSIGGNSIVKLREARNELQVTIDELKTIKKSTFRMLLLKSLDYSGGWGSSHLVDSRAEYFFSLVNEIKEAGCFEELKTEIEKPLEILLKLQLNGFYSLFHNKIFEEDDFPKPMFFYIELNSDLINKVHQNRSPALPFDQKKEEILGAIDTYAKLFLIWKEVKS